MASKKTPSKTPVKTPAKTAAKKTVAAAPLEPAVAADTETVEAVVKAGAQAATKSYEQAIAMAQEQVEKASDSLFKGYDEVAGMSRDNVDACVESSVMLAKGFEALSKELIGFAQSAVEANMATAQALFGAASLEEVIELQRDFSRTRMDQLVAESAKLTELSLALANDTFEPLQSCLNATVEKMMKPLAA